MKYLVLIGLLLLASCTPSSPSGAKVDSLATSLDSLSMRSIRETTISAHRGGPTLGYPENAMESLQKIAAEIPGILIEVDVRESRDGVLLLLHDEELNRTTTGRGKVQQIEWNELASLNLVDNEGTRTEFVIPTLEEVLSWVRRSDAFLSLDVKKRHLFAPVIAMIQETGTQEKVEIITYSTEAALEVYELNPNLYISASIRNYGELEAIRDSGIPGEQIAAFTGLSLRQSEFYEALQEYGAVVTLGTIGNLDRQASRSGDNKYQEWQALGVDRIATDRPRAVYNIIR